MCIFETEAKTKTRKMVETESLADLCSGEIQRKGTKYSAKRQNKARSVEIQCKVVKFSEHEVLMHKKSDKYSKYT